MTETLKETQCKTLREWRKEHGLTVQELADLADTTKSSVSDIELGGRAVDCPSGLRIAEVLGLAVEQIIPADPAGPLNASDWAVDGYADDAPKKPLQWWREFRSVAIKELARGTGVSHQTIRDIEAGRQQRPTLTVRRKLAQGLKVAPEKLILTPLQEMTTKETSVEAIIAAELRRKTRVLRRAYEHFMDPTNSTNKGLDRYYANLKDDLERELQGTR